jgi:hypothetical protein
MSIEALTNGHAGPSRQARSNRRFVLWAVLVVPLLVYLLVFPVRARLDQGVIERHLPYEIWEAMLEGLPGTETDWLLELAFVAGGVAFVIGVLVLIWLALDDSQPDPDPHMVKPAQIDNVPDDEPVPQPVS